MRRAALNLTQPGWVVVGAVAILVGLGVATIYVTDTHYVRHHDGPANAAKQCIRVLVSAALAMVVLQIGYQRISRFAYAIFFITLAMLIPLLIARQLNTTFGGLTAPRNGAYRWIHLPGFPVQPSELMKVAYVLALAWYLRYRKNYRRFFGLLWPVLLSAVPFGLILLEPDLGTALLLAPVLFSMLFLAGARIRHLLIIVLMGVCAAPIAWNQIRGYQRQRVTAVLLQSDTLRKAVVEEPEKYRMLATKRQAIEWAASTGYQLVHSKNAIGSGGALGHGWGRGIYVRSGLLPDRHNDFVFSLIGHQWGFWGSLLVLLCYLAIVAAGCQIASATTEPFGRLLAVGVVTLIASQVLINIGMTVGLMPITGITLPYVSYGGSSLLSGFAALALLISVSQHRPFLLATKPFEFLDEQRRIAHPFDYDEVPIPPHDTPAAGTTRDARDHVIRK
ncbi:MAG: FtsW/RodA/SpoVE family cell cycle protein [Phycisphaerae bacterium]|jgi:cell division protein FtsW (lipid II flippase)